MLEETVWKFLDLLESQGLVEETGQMFSLSKIECSNAVRGQMEYILQRMKRYSHHKSDPKYQVNYVLKK
jgi:hypothetical protein